MKKIAFAILVSGILVLFPIYLIVELSHGVAEIEKKDVNPSFPFRQYPDKTPAINKHDVVKRLANTGHKHLLTKKNEIMKTIL